MDTLAQLWYYLERMKSLLRIGCGSCLRPSDSFQAYGIMVDGEVVARLRFGERASFPIFPGKHELSVRMDRRMSRTEAFEVAEGEEVEFEFGNHSYGRQLLLLASYYLPFPRSPYLWLKRVQTNLGDSSPILTAPLVTLHAPESLVLEKRPSGINEKDFGNSTP